MNFAQYLCESIVKIAAGVPVDLETYRARMDVFFELISRGTKPATARRIMDLYM